MKATETEFKKIIEGTIQFFVPHYQRPYSWERKQWAQLWEDVVALAVERADATQDNPASTHFIGSMVTMPGSSVPQGVSKFVLIDGQQRITTLMLLLAAIRDFANETGEKRHASMIHNLYLTNQYQENLEHFKLLPTEGDDPQSSDRNAFVSVVDPDSAKMVEGHSTTAAYEFFAKNCDIQAQRKSEHS
ncbi:DUF262 domain-containing protein [Enhygromyxa salina]|uniref:GmrSD restriction endonucleases N-terminal domain-containing protein n=1 Tax=Enhygromyxa salina TaxID=215803 RepID=A0A2S9YDK6_9BACT|nr:DUF262 domain-containing protein [Enhygromyxa salina]PRQ03207.1 hypothetical protein ENSA7_53470 [Enhygromyxa salina]